MSAIADDITVSDLVPTADFAREHKVNTSAVRYYEAKWPECFVFINRRHYVVRSRMEARLRANLFRPKKRKQPPPSPQGAGSAADASE